MTRHDRETDVAIFAQKWHVLSPRGKEPWRGSVMENALRWSGTQTWNGSYGEEFHCINHRQPITAEPFARQTSLPHLRRPLLRRAVAQPSPISSFLHLYESVFQTRSLLERRPRKGELKSKEGRKRRGNRKKEGRKENLVPRIKRFSDFSRLIESNVESDRRWSRRDPV